MCAELLVHMEARVAHRWLLLTLIVHNLLCLLFRIHWLLGKHVELDSRLWFYTVTWRLSLLLAYIEQVTALDYDLAFREYLLLLYRFLQIRVRTLSRCQRVLDRFSLYIHLGRKIIFISIWVDDLQSSGLYGMPSSQVLVDYFGLLLDYLEFLLWLLHFRAHKLSK